ncbi:MAG: 3'-5' exonuclease, partial [Gaiellales bacterium]
YRSTPPVLDVANGMLMLAPGAYEKTLWSERRGRARPRLVTCYDEAAQSRWVVDRVLELREQGIDLRDQAVLFRAAHHSDHLELELARRDVPFVKYGGLRFLEAAHVKDLVALLRVLDNPDDELAWTRVIRSLEGVGPAGARRLLVELAVGCGGPARPLERFLAGDGRLPPVAEDDAALLRESWSACRGHEAEPPVAVQVDALRRFCAAVFPRRYDNPDARLADLEALAATSAEHASRGQLLTELVVDPPERTADLAGPPRLDDDYLILSTIHSAKGGEWRAVTVIHAADGNIPSDMALGQPGGVDEELRLLYVAVTRAMDHLAVTYPARFHVNRRRRDDRHLLAQPSRFVEPVRERFEEVSAGEGAAGVDPPVAVGGATSGRSISREVDDFLERLWGDASGS